MCDLYPIPKIYQLVSSLDCVIDKKPCQVSFLLRETLVVEYLEFLLLMDFLYFSYLLGGGGGGGEKHGWGLSHLLRNLSTYL